ncbi:lgrD [Symbiodinium natans]|uniref:LgrD protein n=1 Tax=Symbiodinium natans TaxID=878477 RepID=A0A812SD71_9DINO|nr:lgrD [Symbiodinium natans]
MAMAWDSGQPQDGSMVQDMTANPQSLQVFGKGKGKGSKMDGSGTKAKAKSPPPTVSPDLFSAEVRFLVLSTFSGEMEEDPVTPFEWSVAAALSKVPSFHQLRRTSFDVLPILPVSVMFTDDELDEHQLGRSKRKDPRQTIAAVPSIRLMPGLAHPLTFNEEQMLRLFVTDPRSMAYNLANTQRSRVPLSIEQCEMAHRIVLERHEVLRSAFSLEDHANPTRKVMKDHVGGFYALAVPDEGTAQAVASMDYATPHMLGICAIRLLYSPSRDNFPAMHVNMHHILADNDALLTFWQESFQVQELIYYGYSKEAIKERLPKLPVQFTDFAYWQKSLFSRGLLKPDLSYWGRQIVTSQPPTVLDVPIDIPRPRVWVAVGDSAKIDLDQELMLPIMDLNPRITPFAVVICNFSLALMRMANQRVVYMATAFALRSLPAVANLIGNFLNMLPIRVAYDPRESYMDICSRVAQSTINVQRYNLAPFIQIVSDTQPHFPTADPSRNPVYQSMVDVVPRDDDSDEVGLKGVLDVFLFANTRNGQIFRLDGVFNSTVLTKQTVQLMLMHTKALTLWAARHAKMPIPRMLRLSEMAQEAKDADKGIILTHVLARNQIGLPSVAAMSSGPEGFGISDEQRGIRASRRFKLHSALEMGADIPQSQMKSATLPTPLQPPKRKQASQQRWQELAPRPASNEPAPAAMSILAASETSLAKASPAPQKPAVRELTAEEEVAQRRAEAQKRRERSYNVAAKWAQSEKDSELIPLGQANPFDENEAFPRAARRRGFAQYAAIRGR